MSRYRLRRTSRAWQLLAGWPAGLAVSTVGVLLVLVVLDPFREQLGLVNVALIFLLASVFSAAVWGWGPGLYTAATGNLVYNWYFVPPLHGINLRNSRESVGLFIFLVVGFIASLLVAIARTHANESRRRAMDTELLLVLSELLNGTVEPDDALHPICLRAVLAFHLDFCAVLADDNGVLGVVAASDAAGAELDQQERALAVQVLHSRETAALSDTRAVARDRRTTLIVPMVAGGSASGVMLVRGDPEVLRMDGRTNRLLRAVADQAALAHQRGVLSRKAAEAVALEQSDRLKSALLSSVSHDLRTPLASIKASASSLLQGDIAWDAGSRREFLLAIDEESDRLTRLVSNLLDMSRIDAGHLRLDLDWVDIVDLVHTVVDRFSLLTSTREISLLLPDDLPLVRADYVQLDRVLSNLVENALKYSEPGTPLEIAATAGEAVCISVSDRGRGIPDSLADRVFDKFYRVQGSGSSAEGTGMGLAICRGLIEAHGGQIWVEPRPGGGTVFSFTLPIPERAVTVADRSEQEMIVVEQVRS